MAEQEWEQGLCDGVCGGDSCGTCCASWCCGPCLYGRASQRLDLHPNHDPNQLTVCDTNCWLFAITALCGLHFVPMTIKRTALRETFNIEGNMCQDGLVSACCTPCGIAQMNVEMKKRNEKEKSLPQQGYQAHSQDMTYAPPPGPPAPALYPPQPVHQ